MMKKTSAAIFFIALILILVMACNPSKQDHSAFQNPTIKEVRNENGILEARLTVVDNKLNGKATRYYPSGKIKSVSEYVDNKLNGTEKKFYTDGNLYRTRNYKEGELEGFEYRYYRNGNIKTKLEYKEGNPATGLEEYKSNGIKLIDYPSLKFKLIYERDYKEQILLLTSLNENYRNIRCYDGNLIEGKFFDSKAIPLSSSNGFAEKRIEPEFSGEIVISIKAITGFRCSYITSGKVMIAKGKIIKTILL
ncbi:toxin-antitoxin system YwqK family antitoxin [Bacteroidota bacterium]